MQVLLERAPEGGSPSVQQHLLIGLADPENVTNGLGVRPLNITQNYNLALARWQAGDGLFAIGDQSSIKRSVTIPPPPRL